MRGFSTTRPGFEQEAENPAGTEAKAEGSSGPKVLKRKRVYAWLKGEGEKYLKPRTDRPNWVGGDVPFPLNPTFRPRPPVSNKIKEEMYELYISNPAQWTPRQLGIRFRVSIKRAEAILKLKAIEKQMGEDGLVLQTESTKGMERMLCVQDGNASPEPLVDEVPKVGAPHIKAVEEGTQFTAKDAAKELGRSTYESEVDKAAKNDRPYVIDYPGLSPKFAPRLERQTDGGESSVVLSRDPALGNRRWTFVFTDLRKGLSPVERSVLVRQQDGTLRTATPTEKQKRLREIWSNLEYRV
ncbi:hypothetical protein EV182_000423 [Spiromyces aspiralis]|uniref:Uncharacterized protein n=1 Tax=Spiromyces aspiralis TaxID=68401 RepID=A0ACC1HH26_9FUNG|nr:hypothetical protein EV182_000423 [Spiromyces aspiralis]